MRTVLFAFCLWAATVGAYSLCAQPSPPPERSDLQIAISTTFGVTVEKAQVTLTSVGPGETFRAVGGLAKFSRIPYGLYDLDVALPGFKRREERLAIYLPEVEFRVGLELGYLAERAEIVGSVTGIDKRPTDLWVRLVPVFSGGLIENRVDRAGSFRLAAPTGKYVLLLFQRDRLIAHRPIEFFDGRQTVDIAVDPQETPLTK